MAAIPKLEEEDAKRPTREREQLCPGRAAARNRAPRFVNQQIKQIEDARQKQLEDEPQMGSNAKVLELQRISGLGIETADMRVCEVFSPFQNQGRPRHPRRSGTAGVI